MSSSHTPNLQTRYMQDLYPLYWEICAREAVSRRPYVYDEPCVVTPERFMELERFQHALYRCFRYFLPRYADYSHIVAYSSKAREILDRCDLDATRIGYYRPDFVIPKQGEIKICEIGARYYEAYWGHGHFEHITEDRCGCRNRIGGKRIVERVMDAAYGWWDGLDRSLTILKGRDREGDIRFYRPFFEKAGTELRYIYPDTLQDEMGKLVDGPVLCAFSQMELEALTLPQIDAILASDCLNPLSTIFLLHDKRFLAVLWDDAFRTAALGEEDAAFLKRFLVGTYTRAQDPDLWAHAYENKDAYILKPQLLGKSEGIVPGPLVESAAWQAIFDSPEIEEMVLQEWVDQKVFEGSIDGRRFADYGTGTLLCMEDELLGLGQFRMSSCEVINYIQDDRKMVPWVDTAGEPYDRSHFAL